MSIEYLLRLEPVGANKCGPYLSRSVKWFNGRFIAEAHNSLTLSTVDNIEYPNWFMVGSNY